MDEAERDGAKGAPLTAASNTSLFFCVPPGAEVSRDLVEVMARTCVEASVAGVASILSLWGVRNPRPDFAHSLAHGLLAVVMEHMDEAVAAQLMDPAPDYGRMADQLDGIFGRMPRDAQAGIVTIFRHDQNGDGESHD